MITYFACIQIDVLEDEKPLQKVDSGKWEGDGKSMISSSDSELSKSHASIYKRWKSTNDRVIDHVKGLAEPEGKRYIHCMKLSRYISMVGFHFGLTVSKSLRGDFLTVDSCPGLTALLAFMVLCFLVTSIIILEICSSKIHSRLTVSFIQFTICSGMAFGVGIGIPKLHIFLTSSLAHSMCTVQ